MPLRITLQDYPGADPAMLTTAVTRFRRELERKLGGEAEAAFKAFQNASESSADELTKEEHRLASAYHAAYEAARTAGFRDLGDVQEAYFDVRLT
ncbi:hypothetical protein [Xenophilus sp. Marseille-Q4582]|uniref:hypothetical protein n=1 Tax=Xenophilus sp. Marseille-Q4582 TaxID=2866600 RepID=UPI001CE41E07|nr:hypothetical protein [Xenophilus sp. Marseille-Q4582]